MCHVPADSRHITRTPKSAKGHPYFFMDRSFGKTFSSSFYGMPFGRAGLIFNSPPPKMPTRSTALNGKAWAACSGACATA